MNGNLKEFEKFWSGYTMPGDRISHKYSSMAGWKFALEWALSLNSVRVHDDVYEDIKKELNGKA